MPGTFRASMRTPLDIAESQTAETLWRAVNNPLIAPRRFGSVGRARIELYDQSSEAAHVVASIRDLGWKPISRTPTPAASLLPAP